MRPRKSRKEAQKDFHKAICEMWQAIHDKKESFNTITIEQYTSKYNIGKYAKRFYEGILTQPNVPTMEQAIELRSTINKYINREKYTELPSEGDMFLTEEICMRKLMMTGKYRILRKDWVDIKLEDL